MKNRKMNSKFHTVYFLSLGCPKNRVDTDVMAGTLIEDGLKLVFEPETADIIVVNTCSFIHDAREESIDALLDLAKYKRSGSCKLLIAAGCLPQRYGKELKLAMEEIDLLVGTGIPDKIEKVIKNKYVDTGLLKGRHFLQKENTPRLMTEGQASVYVKISDGCSRNCSFCAIPSIRGRAGSRTIANIVDEVKNLAAHGAVEINLVSQDTAAYGRDLKDDTDLVALLHALNNITGIKWIRILYLYPDNVTDKLLAAIDSLEKVLPYLDIPIQHAAGNMLKAMRRGHGPDKLKEVISRVRNLVKNPFLRTTVLVGFPGETSKDTDALVDFINYAKFNHLGAFRYSNEEGTHAYKLPMNVSKRDSYNRWRRVMAAQRKIVKQNNKELLGREVSVLVEDVADDAGFVLIGRHEGQAPEIDGVTYLASFDAKPGEIVKGKIVDFKDYDVVVEPV